MIFIFGILWFIRTTKTVLFWLYLWQIKEYRIERFADHFRTATGRKSILNKIFYTKLFLVLLCILLFVFLFETSIWISILLFVVVLLYFVESSKFFVDLSRKRLRKPIFTKKAIFIFLTLLLVEGFFLAFVLLWESSLNETSRAITGSDVFHRLFVVFSLLLFDIFILVTVSAVVMGLQPATVFIRNRRLAKAKGKRASFPNLKVVGITGSYGKTSTKEFLAYILSAKFRVLKTPEHQNSEFGVANTILRNLTNEHEVFVCEMGAYRKGEIKALAEAAQPHIGIVTGVNEQHLATFGSMENLLSAEGGKELVDLLPENGAAFIAEKVQSKGVGYDANCRVSFYGTVQNVKVDKDSVSFEIEGVQFTVPAYGGHNVENLVGAIMVARELGMTLEEIAKAAQTMPLELSPLKVKKGLGGATIIDSTYSANPDGVIADLEYLGLYEGKKVLVMPSLIELGPAAKEAHRRIGEKIAQVCDVAIITTKEHFEDIKQGAGQTDKVIYLGSVPEIREKIKGADVILLEGGKDSRLQRVLVQELEV